MLCWEPSRKCFFEFAKEFRESWILWIILYTYTTCKGLPPPAPGAPSGEGYRRILVWFWSVWCCSPDMYLSRERQSFQRWGFATAWSTSLLALPNVAFSSLKKQTPNAAAKLPNAAAKAPGVCSSSDALPGRWLGSADRDVVAKVLRRSGRKSNCILRGWSRKSCKKKPISKHLPWNGIPWC